MFFCFGVLVRVGIENEVSSTVFAVVLLRTAGAVAVFNDVGASALAARVDRLNHGLN